MRAPTLPALLLGLLAVAAAATAYAQSTRIYQWKDAKGVTHYSDSPPPESLKAHDRRIKNGTPEIGDETASKPVETPECTMAKRNRAILANSAPVGRDTNGDGKPDVTFTDEERANQKALADAQIKAYCTPAPAAPAASE